MGPETRPVKRRRLEGSRSLNTSQHQVPSAESDREDSSSDEGSTDDDGEILDGQMEAMNGVEDSEGSESDLEEFKQSATRSLPNGHQRGSSHGEIATDSARKARANKPTVSHKQHAGFSAGTNANFFSIQCDQLLKRVASVGDPAKHPANDLLFRLKSVIENISDTEPLHIDDLVRELRVQGVAIPFPDPQPPADSQIKYAFAKPISINVVGSHALKTFIKIGDKHTIDMMIEMPGALFTEKDYLNYRYFHKRAAYLAHIAAGLKAAKDSDFRVTYDLLHGNCLLPVIIVEQLDDKKKNESAQMRNAIRILATASKETFPNVKLQPGRNCVRLKHQGNTKVKPTIISATPFYNSSLTGDCSIQAYHKFLHTTSLKIAGFKDACILGRVWLRQRGFSSVIGTGGFGNFEWSLLMALLLQGGASNGQPVLSNAYSTQQLFRGTLQYLSSRDLSKQPVFVRGAAVELPKPEPKPFFYDVELQFNVLHKMTNFSYRNLRSEALTATKALGNSLTDHFHSCFIAKVDEPFLAYDVVGRMRIPQASKANKHSDAVDVSAQFATQLHGLLQRGLGDRSTSIAIRIVGKTSWDINIPFPKRERNAEAVLMVNMNGVNASRLVDRGPAPEEQQEVEEFRSFWGEKAELRRFKDGSIHESVVWSGPTPVTIVQEIVGYLVSERFELDSTKHVQFLGPAQGGHVTSLILSNSRLAYFESAEKAFRTLENDIRSVENFPLQVRHVAPTHAQLSRSSMVLPGAGEDSNLPIDVVVQFEASAKWPDNLTAIQMTKIAFLLKFGELLQANDSDINARVGLENERSEHLNKSFLDVIYPAESAEGKHCFRIRIHHDREQTLLRKLLNDSTHRVAAASALAYYNRTFVIASLHTQAIKALSTRFPAFSASARLVKTWFAAHNLSPFFPSQLIELFTARAFLQPEPWQSAQSPVPGFLRTIAFLSSWEWEESPLIVDFSGDMITADHEAIDTRFRAWRTIDPDMARVALFAATNFDTEGVTWTEHVGPPKVVASRMRYLAIAAFDAVRAKGLELDIDQLFHSPLRHYNFIIKLNKKFLPANSRVSKKSKQFKNLQQAAADAQEIGYNPIQTYLSELQRTFSDAALFFWDERGGSVIAGLWNPQIERRRWKVGLPWSTVAVPRQSAGANGAVNGREVNGDDHGVDADAVANKEAMLAEMARLGGDMVASAVLQ